MVPKVPDTLSTRLRYGWYRLRAGRDDILMTYAMYRQAAWVSRHKTNGSKR